MRPEIGILLQCVLGLWIAAGFVDWCCHRHTRIESTSGTAESLCHWLLLIQMAAAIALCVVFRPTALLLGWLAGLWLLHQMTTFLELRWVSPLRPITPLEQMTHSFLEILPIAGMLLLSIPIVDQWVSDQSVVWALERREMAEIQWQNDAWPSLIVMCLVFNGIAYLEETCRCLRWHRRSRSATPR